MIDNVRPNAVAQVATGTLGKLSADRASPTAKYETSVQSAASLPRLLSLVADLSSAPAPVDFARIAQVRRAIADGSYKLDPEALANAIGSRYRKE